MKKKRRGLSPAAAEVWRYMSKSYDSQKPIDFMYTGSRVQIELLDKKFVRLKKTSGGMFITLIDPAPWPGRRSLTFEESSVCGFGRGHTR